MKILSVDTTHGSCSVSILKNDVIASQTTDNENGKQAERLLSIIESCLQESKITYNDLDAIAVNIGPGSFTGVRIGMAAVNGLNLVNKTPLISVTSFESVAYPVFIKNTDKNILVVLDAKRGQVFCQLFDAKLNQLSNGLLLSYDEILDIAPDSNFILTGNGSFLVEGLLNNAKYTFETMFADAVSESENMAFVASNKLKNKDYSHFISPLYIRAPDAKIAKVKKS